MYTYPEILCLLHSPLPQMKMQCNYITLYFIILHYILQNLAIGLTKQSRDSTLKIVDEDLVMCVY